MLQTPKILWLISESVFLWNMDENCWTFNRSDFLYWPPLRILFFAWDEFELILLSFENLDFKSNEGRDSYFYSDLWFGFLEFIREVNKGKYSCWREVELSAIFCCWEKSTRVLSSVYVTSQA